MAWFEIDDESGLTLASTRIIAKATEAAIRLEGLDLTAFSGKHCRIVLHDGTYDVWGWIGEADAAEVLGDELVINGDCSVDSFVKGAGWSHDAVNEEYDHASGAAGALTQDISAVSKRLYKVLQTIKNRTAGNCYALVGYSHKGYYGADGDYTKYITCGSVNSYLQFYANSAFNGSVDDLSAKLVSALGTDAVHIYSDVDLITQSWNGDVDDFGWNLITSLEIEQHVGFGSYQTVLRRRGRR